jgi:hypothetical protein
MSQWLPVERHPNVGANAPRVLVWGPKVGVEMGRIYHYEDGHLMPRAEGYHGDWEITHYMPLPLAPPIARQQHGPVET